MKSNYFGLRYYLIRKPLFKKKVASRGNLSKKQSKRVIPVKTTNLQGPQYYDVNTSESCQTT